MSECIGIWISGMGMLLFFMVMASLLGERDRE